MKKIIKMIGCMVATIMTLSFVAACKKDNGNKSKTIVVPETGKATFANALDKNGKEILLVENGKSDYSIVVPEVKTVYEDYASKEIQRFISESTGCTLPIVYHTGLSANTDNYYISIGNTSLFSGELSVDEYGESGGMIHVDNKTVFLNGAKGYGILNATYKFLNYEIGFKAYALDEVVWETKSKVNLLAFEEYKYLPACDYLMFQYRGYTSGSAVYDAARLGLSSAADGGYTIDGKMYAAFLHNLPSKIVPPSSSLGYDIIRKYKATEIAQYVEENLNAKIAEFKEANGGADPTEEEIEKIKADLDLEWVKEEKSTWYNGNLCLSRPEIVETVAIEVEKLLLQTPSAKYLMLGNEDNSMVCECSSCMKAAPKYGGHGGVSIWFMNGISEYLEKDEFFEKNPQVNPDVKLLYLNYMGYEKAPVEFDKNGNISSVKIKARDNVGSFLCFMLACNGHSLDDPDCEINKAELNKLKGWAQVTGTIGTYLYWTNYYNLYEYFDVWACIQTWSEILSSYNVTFNFAQCVMSNHEVTPFDNLKVYLISEYFANPQAGDFDELVRNFMLNYYKAGASEMYEYFNAIRENVTMIQAIEGSQCVNCYGAGVHYTKPEYWSLNKIEKMLDILKRAYKKVDESQYSAEIKDKLRTRILVEEMTMRHYRFSMWKDSFTSTEYETERAWLTAAHAKFDTKYEGA